MALDDESKSLTPPTRTRAIGAIGQKSPTHGLVTNDQEIDTAVDRVFDPTGGSRPTRTVALWMVTAVLLLALLGGVMWARGGSTPRRTPPRVAQTESKPVTKAETKAAPKAATKTAAVAQQGRAKEARRRTTTLSITSTPRATVYIDGARVGDTPVSGRTLTVGRSYQIRVEKKGYRTRRETLQVSGTKPLRRSYTLQREARR